MAEDLEPVFRRWLDDHYGSVLKVARAYTLTAEDCQDLVQEILMQVWRSLPRFEARADMATWSYRIALNTSMDWHRREHRRRSYRQTVMEVDELPVSTADGAQQAAHKEIIDRLYGAIRQLPKTDAALVLLSLEDLTYRQISEVLGITENNVGVKLNRAKKVLAELMRDHSHES